MLKKIDPEATRQLLEQARQDGENEEALRLDRVMELERQILGARAQYSGILPPAFFVRAYQLDAQGEIDWCEPFFIPDVFDVRQLRQTGQVVAPEGEEADMVREPCPKCGQPALLIGEYYHDIQPLSLTSWTIRLFLFCQHCPRVKDFAEREQQTFDQKRRLRGCK